MSAAQKRCLIVFGAGGALLLYFYSIGGFDVKRTDEINGSFHPAVSYSGGSKNRKSVSIPPVASTAQNSDALQSEKQAFCERHQLDLAGQNKMILNGEHPTVRFWIDRLYSPDAGKREQAFKLFSVAADYGERQIYPKDRDEDTRILFAMGSANFAMGMAAAQSKGQNIFRTIGNQPHMLDLIAAYIPRLDSAETRDDARRVIDFFTLNTYQDRDSNWWKQNFKNSKLAAIYSGLPRSTWMSLPE